MENKTNICGNLEFKCLCITDPKPKVNPCFTHEEQGSRFTLKQPYHYIQISQKSMWNLTIPATHALSPWKPLKNWHLWECQTLWSLLISGFSRWPSWHYSFTYYPVVVEGHRKKSKSDEGNHGEPHTQKSWFPNRPFLRIRTWLKGMESRNVKYLHESFYRYAFSRKFWLSDGITLMPALPAVHSYLLFTSMLLCLATRSKQSEPC